MSWSIDHLECVALRLELGISETGLVPRLLYARESGNEAKARLDGTTRKRSSLVHSQILSRSRGEKSIFLHGCEIQSGSGLGTRLEKNGLGTIALPPQPFYQTLYSIFRGSGSETRKRSASSFLIDELRNIF